MVVFYYKDLEKKIGQIFFNNGKRNLLDKFKLLLWVFPILSRNAFCHELGCGRLDIAWPGVSDVFD